jgi:hypothetical protein
MRHAGYLDDVAVPRDRARTNDVLAGGGGAGLVAGAAMIAFMMAAAAAAGLGPAWPLELTAGTLMGADALERGAAAALLGLLIWAVVSAALGVLFAALTPRDYSFASAAVVGLGYALLVMPIMVTLVLPRVNPTMRAEMPATGGAWVLAYAVFGVLLGLVPRFRRRFAALARR